MIDSSGSISSPQSSSYSMWIQQTGSIAPTPTTWQRGSFLMAKLWGGSQSGGSLLQRNNQLFKIPCASGIWSCTPTSLLSSQLFERYFVDNNSGTITLLLAKSQDVLALDYASREAIWARASTCVHGHERRHRQAGPEVLRQETTQIGIWILNTCTQTLFVFALITLYISREMQNLRALIVTHRSI